MALWTVLLFAVVEPFTGHVVEPLAFGHRTGLTPVAVIVSAFILCGIYVRRANTQFYALIHRVIERAK